MKTKRDAKEFHRLVMRCTGLVTALLILTALISSVQGDTVTLRPVADTTLQDAFPNNNFGGGTTVQAGGRRQGGRARALLRFDVAAIVPAGSTINSVAVTLTVVKTPTGGANSVFDVNRLQFLDL